MSNNKIIIEAFNNNCSETINQLTKIERSKDNIKPYFHLFHIKTFGKGATNSTLGIISDSSTSWKARSNYSLNGFFDCLTETINNFQSINSHPDKPKTLILSDYTTIIANCSEKEKKSLQAIIENLLSVSASQNSYIWIVTQSSLAVNLNLSSSAINLCKLEPVNSIT